MKQSQPSAHVQLAPRTDQPAPRVSVIESVLGQDVFMGLPECVQQVHGANGGRFVGHAHIERGAGLLSRLCARVCGLPKAQPMASAVVVIEPTLQGERWTRRFAGSTMQSKLRAAIGTKPDTRVLVEQLGPVRFDFQLVIDAMGFTWRVLRVSVVGVVLPVRWFQGVRARSFAVNGAYQFDVQASLPLIGLIVAYRGQLEPCQA